MEEKSKACEQENGNFAEIMEKSYYEAKRRMNH